MDTYDKKLTSIKKKLLKIDINIAMAIYLEVNKQTITKLIQKREKLLLQRDIILGLIAFTV